MGVLPLAPFAVFFPPFLVLVVFLAKTFRFAVVFVVFAVVFVVFFPALALRALVATLRALVATFLPDFLAALVVTFFLEDVVAGLDAARLTVFFGLAGALPAVLFLVLVVFVADFVVADFVVVFLVFVLIFFTFF